MPLLTRGTGNGRLLPPSELARSHVVAIGCSCRQLSILERREPSLPLVFVIWCVAGQ